MMTVIACLLSSCDKEIKFKGNYSGEKIVMYSLANTELDTLSVLLKKSQFFLDDDYDPTWKEMTGATVTGEINGKSVTFAESITTPGTYEYPYNVKEGDVISIKASKKGFKDASATVTVPKKPSFEIKSVKVVESSEYIFGKEIQVKVTIHDDANVANYYRVVPLQKTYSYDIDDLCWKRSYAITKDILFLNAGSDFFDDIEDAINGDAGETWIELPVDDGLMNGKDYTFEYIVNAYNFDEVIYYDENGNYLPERKDWEVDLSQYKLKIECISDDLYKYELSRDAYDYSDDTGLLSEPVCIHNNINGGIGCFGASSSVTLSYDKTK